VYPTWGGGKRKDSGEDWAVRSIEKNEAGGFNHQRSGTGGIAYPGETDDAAVREVGS